MPSIIGSSLIQGNLTEVNGPTGHTGPVGITGPAGSTGTVLGNTGTTGIHISNAFSDLNNNRITFRLSNGTTIGPIFGFTGPTINYYNSDGICGAIGSDYYSIFYGISGGLTFNFRGVTGDNQYVTASMSPDNNEILLSLNNISAGTIIYGNTGDNFVAYTTASQSATNTNIQVVDQLFEDTSSLFNSSFETAYLEFGLTANSYTTPVDKIRVYTEFETPYVEIPSINRGAVDFIPNPGIVDVNSDGYVLDLDKFSVFKLATPIGIASFQTKQEYVNKLSSWTFFIEGSDVWNFPPDVLFDGGITGIGEYAFSSGMNILQLTKSSTDPYYRASFVDRFIGSPITTPQFGGIGSCCHASGCLDYITQEACIDQYGGVFNSIRSCNEVCRIGKCCIDGTCYNNVTQQICLDATGNPDAWTPNSVCSGTSCVPGKNTYTITKISENLQISNRTIIGDPTTWVKVLTVRINTDDPDATLSIKNSSITIPALGINVGKFTFNPSDPQITNINVNDSGEYSVYFTNSEDSIYDGIPGNISINVTIDLKSKTNVTERTLITNNIVIKYANLCGNNYDSTKIRSAFTLNRYCRDCVNIEDRGGGVVTTTFIPVQQQNGTIDLCINDTTKQITPLCITADDIFDLNGCTGTNIGSMNGEQYKNCVHKEYQLGNHCDDIIQDPDFGEVDCSQAIATCSSSEGHTARCKGGFEQLCPGGLSAYWYDINFFPNDYTFTQNLINAGITLTTEIVNKTNSIKSLIKTVTGNDNTEPLFFTAINKNTTKTYETTDPVPCCDWDDANTTFDNLILEVRPDIKYFLFAVSHQEISQVCMGGNDGTNTENDGDLGIPNPCISYKSGFSESVIRWIILKVPVIANTYTINTGLSACVVYYGVSTCVKNCYFESGGGQNTCTDRTCSPSITKNLDPDNTFGVINEIVPDAQGRVLKINNCVKINDSLNCNTSDYTTAEYVSNSGTYIPKYTYVSSDSFPGSSSSERGEALVLFKEKLKKLYVDSVKCNRDYSINCPEAPLFDCITGTIDTSEYGNPNALECNTNLDPAVKNKVLILEESVVSGTKIITPTIYDLNLSNNTLIKNTTDWLYYNTGYNITDNETDKPQTFTDSIKLIQSGTEISLENYSDLVLYVYYTNGQNEEYTARTAPVRIIKNYYSVSEKIQPILDFIPNYIGTPTKPKFRLESTVPTGFWLNAIPWVPITWRYDVWFWANGQSNRLTYSDNADYFNREAYDWSMTVPEVSSDLLDTTKADNQNGYNSDTQMKIWITLSALFLDVNTYNQSSTDDFPWQPGYRWLETTKLITINKSVAPSFIDNSYTVNKLITLENGQTECISINCFNTNPDCHLLPDC